MSKLIRVAALVLLLGAFLATGRGSGQTASGAPTKEAQAAATPAGVLSALRDGNARFVSGQTMHRDLQGLVRATAGGQYPLAAIVGCMDSRVPVEIVFDQAIGDLFTIRVAGNVVNPDVLGSLEYATKVAGSKLIVVLGHSSCGAVKGAIEGEKLGNLTGLLAKIEPAIAASGPKGTAEDAAYVSRVVEQNVRVGMKAIRDGSPTLRQMLDAGTIGLAGGIYDLKTGKVTLLAD